MMCLEEILQKYFKYYIILMYNFNKLLTKTLHETIFYGVDTWFLFINLEIISMPYIYVKYNYIFVFLSEESSLAHPNIWASQFPSYIQWQNKLYFNKCTEVIYINEIYVLYHLDLPFYKLCYDSERWNGQVWEVRREVRDPGRDFHNWLGDCWQDPQLGESGERRR